MDDGQRRTFDSGATRGTAEGKIDLEGAFSVLSLERYGQYMLEHETDSAGEKRASDNWQAGFPLRSYVKSLLRHLLALWKVDRGFMDLGPKFLEDTLCAIIFNAQGYLHVHLSKTMRADHSDRCVPDDLCLTDPPPSTVDYLIRSVGGLPDGIPYRGFCSTCHKSVWEMECCKAHCFECSDHHGRI